MVKCNVCLGTYEPIQADGSTYFHACPPLSVPELRDALAKKTVTLSPSQQALVDAAAKIDADPLATKLDVPRADVVLASMTIERPNKRDENVTGLASDGKTPIQKAPGTGTTKV